MNDFNDKIKLTKEQLQYIEYKRKKYAKEIHKQKWKNAYNKLKGDER